MELNDRSAADNEPKTDTSEQGQGNRPVPFKPNRAQRRKFRLFRGPGGTRRRNFKVAKGHWVQVERAERAQRAAEEAANG